MIDTTRLLKSFAQFVEQDNAIAEYILQLLNAQLQALHKGDYAEVEYICTALIETLQEA